MKVSGFMTISLKIKDYFLAFGMKRAVGKMVISSWEVRTEAEGRGSNDHFYARREDLIYAYLPWVGFEQDCYPAKYV